MKKLHSKEVKISKKKKGKIAEQVTMLAANLDDLSSIPRIHIVREETHLLQAVPCPICAYCHDSLSHKKF